MGLLARGRVGVWKLDLNLKTSLSVQIESGYRDQGLFQIPAEGVEGFGLRGWAPKMQDFGSPQLNLVARNGASAPLPE